MTIICAWCKEVIAWSTEPTCCRESHGICDACACRELNTAVTLSRTESVLLRLEEIDLGGEG